MGTFVYILAGLGACSLTLLLAVGVFFLLVKRKLAKLAAGIATSDGRSPIRLHLHRAAVDAPPLPEEAARLCGEFAALGFEQVGPFAIEEMPTTRLVGFAHPTERLGAAVYHMDGIGAWCDLVARYPEGIELTVSSAPDMGRVDLRPGKRTVFEPAARPERLLELFLEARGPEPALPFEPEHFARIFEESYAEDMDWRTLRGPATDDEIRRVAAASGTAISEADLERMRALERAKWLNSVWDLLALRFGQSPEAPADWDRRREEAVFIHDRMSPEDVLAACGALELDVPGLEDIRGGAAGLLGARYDTSLPARGLFQNIVDRMEPELRPTRIGALKKPMEAEVWWPRG
ncbi:MAG: hypothetical protein SF028_01305 [Candidatus Sumerlaeia bacterium]|nr:hypothetical protein [Candidatus Sumerlaeia bacterium]